jgi:hypothetical protein
MRIVLDEQPCKIDATSVGEAIRAATAIAERRGRMIVDVIVDGRTWEQSELDSADARAAAAEEVRMTSADVRELVCGALEEAAANLATADELQREAGERLQKGDAQEAMTSLNDALSMWITVHEAVSRSADALGLDLGSIAAGDRTVSTCVDDLNAALTSLRRALEVKDHVALADALMYEWPETIAQWREALSAMRDHVQSELT